MPRILRDQWIDKDATLEFTSPEGIHITIVNKSVSNKRLRIQMMFKRGRKRKGEQMANPKINGDGSVEGLV